MGGQTTVDSTFMYQNRGYGAYPYQNSAYMFSPAALEQDIYGRQLEWALNNGQVNFDVSVPNGGAGGGTPQNTQAASGGSPLLWGLGLGGATYAAGTGFGLFKPVGEDGKFTESFLNHYSGEYQSMMNGTFNKEVFSWLGNGVDETNFKTVVTDLEKLGLEKDPAKIAEMAKTNPLLKSVLEKHGIVDAKGALIQGKSLEDVRIIFSKSKGLCDFREAMNNYSVIGQRIKRFDGLEEIWKNCTTRDMQIDFLKKNSDILGLKPEQIRDLHFNPEKVNLNEFKNMGERIGTWRAKWTEIFGRTEAEMQGLSGIWRKGAKWYEKGVFGTAEKAGTSTALVSGRALTSAGREAAAAGLNNSYKTFLRRKSLIAAAVVAIGAWAYCKWIKN